MATMARRKGRGGSGFWLVVVAVLMIGVLYLGYAAGTGNMPDFLAKLPFFEKFAKAKETERPAGTEAYPVAGRPIEAFAEVSTEDLWDFESNLPKVTFLRPEKMPEGVLRDLGQIRGRVLKDDKSPGMVFLESDFLPKGTRPGVTAGVPPGWSGMAVDAKRVQGLDQLGRGDCFNIQATIPLDEDGARDLKAFGNGELARHLQFRSTWNNLDKQATVQTIVRGAMVIRPAVPLPLATGAPSPQGGQAQALSASARDLQIEAYIAVAPEEVTFLNEAFAVGAELTAVASSGRPGDPGIVPPDHSPSTPLGAIAGEDSYTLVETIKGMDRTHELVPVKKQKTN